jgi:hypothetical protein
MSHEDITKANTLIESIDKRFENLETLTLKALDKEKAVDGELTCPITHELFVDPVFCTGDGQTYERSAIEKYLKHNTKSPISRLELQSTEIWPNFHARKLADMHRQGGDPEGRSNETQVVKKQIPPATLRRDLGGPQLFAPGWFPAPEFNDSDDEEYSGSDSSSESPSPRLPDEVTTFVGGTINWTSRLVSFNHLEAMRNAATGIGHRNVHKDLSWGWGLNGYLGMLDTEPFSREDLENSEQVEAGVWIDWDTRSMKTHSAVVRVLQTIYEEHGRPS